MTKRSIARKRLARKLKQAKAGNQTALKAFNQLGINIQDSTNSIANVFTKIFRALKGRTR